MKKMSKKQINEMRGFAPGRRLSPEERPAPIPCKKVEQLKTCYTRKDKHKVGALKF